MVQSISLRSVPVVSRLIFKNRMHPTSVAFLPRLLSDQTSKGSKKSDDSGKSKELQNIIACLDAPTKKEGPIPEEEQERRKVVGRDYVIGCFKEHNAIDHDLTCKIRLKEHAIRMLPKGTKMREEALKISDEMPPKWRNIPVWTPPIEGFDSNEFSELK